MTRMGHETRDVSVRGIALFGAALAAMVLLVLGAMVLWFDHLASSESRLQREPVSMVTRGTRGAARPANPMPPDPRLQDDPAGDLARMRAEEQKALDGYGWVDRDRGVVSVPIEKAMEIVVKKGLR